MIQLDKDDDVISWTKRHGISIPYEYNDIMHNYIPDFLIEYKFKDLYYQESRCPLRFDFAIMNKEKVRGLIEYQGWQHQYPVECFCGKKEFEKRKIRDKLKVEYCLENNIPLLIIYPDDNIREKINNFMEDLV